MTDARSARQHPPRRGRGRRAALLATRRLRRMFDRDLDVGRVSSAPPAKNIGVPAHRITEDVANLLADASFWLEHATYPLDEIAVAPPPPSDLHPPVPERQRASRPAARGRVPGRHGLEPLHVGIGRPGRDWRSSQCALPHALRRCGPGDLSALLASCGVERPARVAGRQGREERGWRGRCPTLRAQRAAGGRRPRRPRDAAPARTTASGTLGPASPSYSCATMPRTSAGEPALHAAPPSRALPGARAWAPPSPAAMFVMVEMPRHREAARPRRDHLRHGAHPDRVARRAASASRSRPWSRTRARAAPRTRLPRAATPCSAATRRASERSSASYGSLMSGKRSSPGSTGPTSGLRNAEVDVVGDEHQRARAGRCGGCRPRRW